MKGKILLAAISTFMLAGCGGVIGEVKNANIPVFGIGQYKIGDVLDSRSGCDSVSWKTIEHKGAEVVEYTCEFFNEEAEKRIDEEWANVLAALEKRKQELRKDTSNNGQLATYIRSDENFDRLTRNAKIELGQTFDSSTRGSIVAQFVIENNEVRLTYASEQRYVSDIYEKSIVWKAPDEFYHSMVEDAPLTKIIAPLSDSQIFGILLGADRR